MKIRSWRFKGEHLSYLHVSYDEQIYSKVFSEHKFENLPLCQDGAYPLHLQYLLSVNEIVKIYKENGYMKSKY